MALIKLQRTIGNLVQFFEVKVKLFLVASKFGFHLSVGLKS